MKYTITLLIAVIVAFSACKKGKHDYPQTWVCLGHDSIVSSFPPRLTTYVAFRDTLKNYTESQIIYYMNTHKHIVDTLFHGGHDSLTIRYLRIADCDVP